MIQDPTLVAAVPRILQRSERQVDIEKLTKTFVDVGILPQVKSRNNQVIHGRRGTGKTHILKKLQTDIGGESNTLVVYLDARSLGSTSQFSDPSLPIRQRCICLFRDFLAEIYNSLLEHVTDVKNRAEGAFEPLHKFGEFISNPVYAADKQEITKREMNLSGSETATTLKLGMPKNSSVQFGDKETNSNESETTTTATVRKEDKVIFPELHSHLNDVLKAAGAHMFILFDEWSSLPMDIQPYLAEFIRRGILPNPEITIKIASLEYRSQFVAHLPEGRAFGIELGSDISASLDVDDYYIYDKSPKFVTEAFGDILFRHLTSELPDDYLQSKHGVANASQLQSKMFTERATFVELVRAAEGVARDLINIFTSAFFDAHRRKLERIDRKAVVEAARQWYEKDKQKDLAEELKEVLGRIVKEVIGSRKARSFLLPRELEKHPTIQRLFDMRVLHLMHRGYADKENPGVRYNIYTLDYGTYVDLKNTSQEPQIDFVEFSEGKDLVVPFDDKRSIRRIVLNKEILNPIQAPLGLN